MPFNLALFVIVGACFVVFTKCRAKPPMCALGPIWAFPLWEFRYAYYLWFEDMEGQKLAPVNELGPITDPLDASIYRLLIKRYANDCSPALYTKNPVFGHAAAVLESTWLRVLFVHASLRSTMLLVASPFRMFPDAKPGSVRCYELYTIHLSCVPFNFAAEQGQALVRELRDSNPDVQF